MNLLPKIVGYYFVCHFPNHPQANFLVMSWATVPQETAANIIRDRLRPLILTPTFEPGDPYFDQVMAGSSGLDTLDPAFTAVIRWQQSGPILFIGEHSESGGTYSPAMFQYLEAHYDAISFKNQYQPSPGMKDYPTLYIPKETRK